MSSLYLAALLWEEPKGGDERERGRRAGELSHLSQP